MLVVYPYEEFFTNIYPNFFPYGLQYFQPFFCMEDTVPNVRWGHCCRANSFPGFLDLLLKLGFGQGCGFARSLREVLIDPDCSEFRISPDSSFDNDLFWCRARFAIRADPLVQLRNFRGCLQLLSLLPNRL